MLSIRISLLTALIACIVLLVVGCDAHYGEHGSHAESASHADEGDGHSHNSDESHTDVHDGDDHDHGADEHHADGEGEAHDDDAPKAADDAKPMVYVKMETSMGDIHIELNREKAPITVKNFLSYTDKKFYDGTIFHRVMPGFMIQGGGLTADLDKKPTDPPIENEWKNGLKNVRGSLAMARTQSPNSATAQFFINVVDNPNLDGAMVADGRDVTGGAGYAVFGNVVGGMDVVDAITMVPTGYAKGRANVPREAVIIKTVRRIDPDAVIRDKANVDE